MPFWPYLRLEQKRKPPASVREDLQQFLRGDGHGFLRTEGPHLAGYQISGTKKPLNAAYVFRGEVLDDDSETLHALAHYYGNRVDFRVSQSDCEYRHRGNIDKRAIPDHVPADAEGLVVQDSSR